MSTYNNNPFMFTSQYGGGRGGASAGGGDSGWGTEWNSDSVNSEVNGTSAWSPGGGEEEEW